MLGSGRRDTGQRRRPRKLRLKHRSRNIYRLEAPIRSICHLQRFSRSLRPLRSRISSPRWSSRSCSSHIHPNNQRPSHRRIDDSLARYRNGARSATVGLSRKAHRFLGRPDLDKPA